MMSVFGHGHAAPVNGAVKSVPSIWYIFSFVLDPRMECENAVLSNRIGAEPGAIWTKSKKVNRAIGVFFTLSCVKFVENPGFVGSTNGVSPVMTISSFT